MISSETPAPNKRNAIPHTQLYCIIARTTPTAVIFRRGPSKRVQLIKWNLRDDTFEMGQWLKGRIYERRSDLSPDGEKLIYFAANWKPKKGPLSWTAVSRPPYLTALAMWPKGDAWGGGGQFYSEKTILLNHVDGYLTLDDKFTLPKKLRVKPFGQHSGRGEDDPIYTARLIRDGWKVTHVGKSRSGWGTKVSWVIDPPHIYQKHMPRNKGVSLQMHLKGIHEKQNSWYLIDHEIVTRSGDTILKLPQTSWADWDSDGDLLYADGGKLFRLNASDICQGVTSSNAKKIADFSDARFSELPPPPEALVW